MIDSNNSVNLHVYGLHVELQSADGKTVDTIRREFRYFEGAPGSADVTIEVFDEEPPFGSLPDIAPSVYTIDYVTYHSKQEVFTDYHGRGIKIFRPEHNKYLVFSKSADLRHEISYLTILSTVGKFLDSIHIHRVHGLGITFNGKAILILLPEMGGKSTLALQLLRSGEVKLLSEDSPLLNRRREILPFPLRLGVRPGGESGIPEKYLYPVNLVRAGIKIMIDIEYFRDRIGSACQLDTLIIGERNLGIASTIEPVSRMNATMKLIENSVIGMGLHQGMEYLLGRNVWDILRRSSVALSRLNNSLKASSKCRAYRFVIGHDPERNIQVLLDFLKNI